MGPAAGLRAAALVAGLALAGGAAKGGRLRACTNDDWQLTFTECTEDLAGYRSRAAFAYAPEEVCDVEARSSRSVPEPLLNLPCHQPCERGERLSIDVVPPPQAFPEPAASLAVRCEACESGRFSLGGGHLVDGGSGDWAPTPTQLTTFCSYRGTDYQWHAGSGAPMVCMLRVSSSPSPSSDDLVTETRPGTWNGELPDAELDLALAAAPGDTLACDSIEGEAVRGRAVLVLRGVCAFSQKTDNLAAAGALAVVVYDNVPDAGYFYPSPEANASQPTIPIFMITNEEGLRWLDRLATSSDVRLRAATTRCSDARLEALPVGAGEGNSSAEYLAQETWESIVDRLGCSPWVADPSGKFMHSGNNLHFHWLYSVLAIDVRFVRDGHLRFRYSVDSEDQYDGLIFLMDHVQQSPIISQQAPQGEWRVEVPRGSHTFTWMYTKDFAGTAGADQARLYLLEIVGDAFADEECRSCKGALLHGVHGAEACSGCEDGKYIDSDGSCKNCADGFWAPAGAVGEASCLRRLPCTDDDIEVSYSAFEVADGGAHQALPGEHCRRNESLVAYAWRRPRRCDPSLDGSARLPEANPAVGPCPPCQTREARPASGGDCEPKVPSCPAGEHPQRELSIASWQVWPRNFSTEVFGSGGSTAGEGGGTRWGWRLAYDGSAAVVGAASDGEVDSGVARLHLDLQMASAGHLTAFIRINPASAWGRHAVVLVNGSRMSGERLEGPLGQGSPPLFRLVVPLPSGQQRVSWSWSSEGAAGAESVAADGGGALEEIGWTGMLIANVSIPHVAGAGALSCAGCPDGEEVASDGSSCQACPAGRARSASSGSSGCQECPSGRAAEAGAAECRTCGAGLQSAAGAARCEPRAFLEIENFLGGHAAAPRRRWSTEAILTAWSGLAADNRTESLLPMRVEDRLFYFSALASPRAQPSAQSAAAAAGAGAAAERLAYWWERLPPAPRAAAPAGAGPPAAAAAAAGAATDGVCEADGVGAAAASFRAVGALLEGLAPAAEGELVGVWALFSSECGGDGRAPTPSRRTRAARLFMRCERPEPLLAIAAAAIMDSLGNSSSPSSSPSSLDVLQGSFFDDESRPSSPHSCEDITVEWRTSAACPSCMADDFAPVASGPCDDKGGGRRQRMVYVSRVPCFGGAEPPQAYWASCDEESNPLNMMLAIVIPAVFMGCCLCCYVIILRRRYAKYAVLEEEEEGPRSAGRLADGAISVPATSLGAPSNFA